MNIRQMASNVIRRNPQIANNPKAQKYLSVIENGSDQQGQELAINILNSHGLTKEQAMNDISKAWNIPI